MEQRTSLRWLVVTTLVITALLPVYQAKKTICIRQKSEANVLIYGGMEAGNFVNLGTVSDIRECLNKACDSEKGNIAFLLQQTCFSVRCHNMQSCKLESTSIAGTNTAGALYQVIAAYPNFKNAKSVYNVGEDISSGSEIISLDVTAESRKRDMETMSFELIKGNTHTFRLYPKSSNHRVTIRTKKPLDREKIPSYHLIIKATNKVENVSTLVNITIDVTDINDNPPRFTKSLFVLNVFSNTSLQTILGKVVAKDKDTGKIKYSINPTPDFVKLDENTGEIKLIKLLRVDAIQTSQYKITATDGDFTTNARLKIDVYPNNVNRPTFEKLSYDIRLSGQAPIGTEVLRVSARDPDFGKLGELTFLISEGNVDDVFMISKEGRITTTDDIPLQREQYNLTIQVHDNGYPQLYAVNTVNIIISLLWLRFKQDLYETAVLEDHSVSRRVITVSASLWDGGVQMQAGQRKRRASGVNYYVEDGPGLDVFEMEETTGIITLQQSLDYEKRKFYELVLKADYESGDSTTTRTLLTANAILRLHVMDVNDNRPTFSPLVYSQDVWRSSKVNSPVLKINTTDKDDGRNGQIRFVVQSGNINDTFSFHPDGMVFLMKSLEKTPISTFNITVVAWDHGSPKPLRSAGTALVSIHVHGYTPSVLVFLKNSYSASVMENGRVGEHIVQVKAAGAGQTTVTYWMKESKEKVPFQVNPSSGWINNTEKLDREKKSEYVLRIVAGTDLDRMSVTTFVDVTIRLKDMNDNNPVFTQDDYSTTLTSHHVGADIVRVKATDKDFGRNARIAYKISGGKDKKYFTINTRTGQIRTKRSLPTKSLVVLKFYVSAKDHGSPSLTSLRNVPVFVLVSTTFPITVVPLKRTSTEITLRFTMVNVTLEDVSYIGVVAQETGTSAEFEEVTKRPLVSWFYIRNGKGNGLYAQRYLTGKVQCTEEIRKSKTFVFTVGGDGNKCTSDRLFCNGRLQAEKRYRFQLVAYFKNGSSPKNVTFVESEISEDIGTEVTQAKQIAGFRSWRYDIIVIVLGIALGLIIIVTITRALMLYRKDKERMKKEETKDGISYPLSNPRYHRSGEHSASSRSTISFTELNKSRKTDRRSEKTSPCESEKLQDVQDDTEGNSRDSGCGVSVKSPDSEVRRAFFTFGQKDKEEEQEEASDKEMETVLN